MPVCKKCGERFPNRVKIDGKRQRGVILKPGAITGENVSVGRPQGGVGVDGRSTARVDLEV